MLVVLFVCADRVLAEPGSRANDVGTIRDYAMKTDGELAAGGSRELDPAAIAWKNEFSEVAELVRNAFPNLISQARIDRPGEFGGTIEFVGPVPAGAAALVGSVSGVRLVGGASFTEAQVKDSVSAVHYALFDRSSPFSYATEYNVGRASIIAYVYPDDPDQVGTVDVASLTETALTAIGGVPVVRGAAPLAVMVVEGPVGGAGDDQVRGGTQMSTCTSGWSVRSLVGASEGIITAEHCGRNQRYDGRDILTFGRALPDREGDIEYLFASEDAIPRFRRSTSEVIPVESSVTPTTNGTYCKYGKTTFRTCDVMYFFGSCRDQYCNLEAVANRKADTGDSGGPWYSGSAAVGVHSGYYVSLEGRRDQFTSIRNNIGPNLSVNLKLAS